MKLIDDLDEKPQEFIEMVKNYANNPKGFFLIAGSNGNGKSYSARCIYEENARFILPDHDNDEAIFIKHDDLKDLLTETFNQWSSLSYLKETYSKTKLLIIDDLGCRAPTEQMIGFLHSILDNRFEDRSDIATLITTNLNAKEFASKFGDAILSRCSSGLKYRLDSPDRRPHDQF